MKWETLKKLTLIEQGLFGLPWILIGVLLPCIDSDITLEMIPWTQWIFVLLAFLSARTAGMAFNRVLDRTFDAQNPRTSGRVLPSGEATTLQVTILAWVNVGVFVVACGMINPLCLGLSPLAVFLLWAYSYTKRFTALCHLILGMVHGFSVILAWAATAGTLSWGAVPLAFAVMSSIAGMDIVYAVQDYAFDIKAGLYSIPVVAGPRRALMIARLLHLLVVLLLWLTGVLLAMPVAFFQGLVVVALVYGYYHRKIDLSSNKALDTAFFGCNIAVGVVLLIATTGALAWNGLL